MAITMKNKLYYLLWVILFSWIIVFGSSLANTRSCDTGFGLCNPVIIMGSGTESSLSPCIYNFQKSISFSDVTCGNDFCCKDKECDSDEDFLFNPQNQPFQKQFVIYVITPPKPLTKDMVANSFFKYHKRLQTTPIYILTQSFLC